MSVFLNSLLLLLGAVFGSFVSAYTFRYPKGIAVTKGRSFCPHCKAQIVWFDNIPLLSFLILGGHCRHCHKKISFRYPLIELIAAVGFLIIGWNFFWLIMFLILLSIFVIDLEHQIIPDSLVFPGLALSLFIASPALYGNFFVGFLAATLLLLVHLATRGRGMGLGDVKFAVLGGMLTGALMPIWLLAAFLTGGIAGVILIFAGRAKLKTKIAFGPFLIIAIPACLIWGEKILVLLW